MKYKVQLELNIETEKDMEMLTKIMHSVVRGLTYLPHGLQPVQPDFVSAEIEQLTVKRLAKDPEGGEE